MCRRRIMLNHVKASGRINKKMPKKKKTTCRSSWETAQSYRKLGRKLSLNHEYVRRMNERVIVYNHKQTISNKLLSKKVLVWLVKSSKDRCTPSAAPSGLHVKQVFTRINILMKALQ